MQIIILFSFITVCSVVSEYKSIFQTFAQPIIYSFEQTGETYSGSQDWCSLHDGPRSRSYCDGHLNGSLFLWKFAIKIFKITVRPFTVIFRNQTMSSDANRRMSSFGGAKSIRKDSRPITEKAFQQAAQSRVIIY